MDMLKTKKVILLVHDKVEDMEINYPYYRLIEAGFEVDIAGEKEGAVYYGKYGYPTTATKSFDNIDYKNYDGIIIPGGYAPDKLRRYEKVLEMVKYFDDSKKPIGQICHAGWVCISAKIFKDRQATSFFAIKDDLVNAGAKWIDKAVVVDKNLVSAQTEKDLPEFMREFLKLL
ncbi:MAG: type 1 glutamine amidotransferase [Firmicutes bacterium]|nr:type 1 glutamine amidotransferase [Bacillota bacterium]